MATGIVRDGLFLEHIIDSFHPECPERLESIYAMLDTLKHDGLVFPSRRFATHDEIALNHASAYIEWIAGTKGKGHTRLDPDTAASDRSYEAASAAVGGVLQLADMLMAGEITNGFALVRPPGHHAEYNRAMGFCIFNNVAVGARYLEKVYGLTRILIVDFDLHHGNGTQHSFYDDATVLYFSTHQYPYYPGTGRMEETGKGKGEGFTINVPLSYGMGNADYLYAFRKILVPVAEAFRPEIVLVSAGFDTYYDDPLGGMVLTEEGFVSMTQVLLEIARKDCGGKVLFTLEGGYHIAGLTSSVQSVILELKGASSVPAGSADPSAEMQRTVVQVQDVLRPYWNVF